MQEVRGVVFIIEGTCDMSNMSGLSPSAVSSNGTVRPSSFTAVLSLGGLCQVSYQIERRFGFKINSPFDWLVTPLCSIAKIFSDDGGSFGKSIKVINEGSTAVCANYGVSYQHDYRREENDQRNIIIDIESMEKSRSKMIYKYKKFIDFLSQNPHTLFIRLGGHHNSALPTPYIKDPDPVTIKELNNLCYEIAKKFPLLYFELAFVYFSEFTTLIEDDNIDPRLQIFRFACKSSYEWFGEDIVWAELFDNYKFNLVDSKNTAKQFGDSSWAYEMLHP